MQSIRRLPSNGVFNAHLSWVGRRGDPTEERRRLNAQGTGPLYSGGRGLWRRRLLSTRFFLSEFKTDFAIVQLQMRRKWAAFLGNELRQQIGLASRDQLQHLL